MISILAIPGRRRRLKPVDGEALAQFFGQSTTACDRHISAPRSWAAYERRLDITRHGAQAMSRLRSLDGRRVLGPALDLTATRNAAFTRRPSRLVAAEDVGSGKIQLMVANSPARNRVKRTVDWVTSNPGDALTLVLLVPLAVLTIWFFFDASIRASLVAVFAALGIALTLLIIIDRNRMRSITSNVDHALSLIDVGEVREIKPSQINGELDALLATAKEWRFRGGSARWQRSDVLPALAKIKDAEVRYQALILSPFDADLCSSYADYRQKSREQEDVDARTVRLDLLAFLYAVAVWQTSSRIAAEIALITTYSPLRVDGNSTALIVTVADKSTPALRANEDGWYYRSLADEFNLHRQAAPLSLPNAPSRPDAASTQEVRAYFKALLDINHGLPSRAVDDLKEQDWQDVVQRAFPE